MLVNNKLGHWILPPLTCDSPGPPGRHGGLGEVNVSDVRELLIKADGEPVPVPGLYDGNRGKGRVVEDGELNARLETVTGL